MPARIVVVHDEPAFVEPLATGLTTVGYDVATFNDSLLAWNALEAANKVELLITRIRFPPGKPHGVALAKRACANRPGVRVLFVALPEFECYTEDLGVFPAMPIDPAQVVAAAARLLASSLAV